MELIVSEVTPEEALATFVATGGKPVLVLPGSIAGGLITNPAAATEPLYVNPVKPPGLVANGSTVALQPGDSWNMIPGQLSGTYVNAESNGHLFSAVLVGI